MSKTLDAASLKIDQLVEHPAFGVGKLLNVEGDRLTIYFKKDGVTRKLSAFHAPLAVAADQADPAFEGVKLVVSKTKPPTTRKKTGSKSTDKYPTFEAAVEGFRKAFPQGFEDPKYLEDSKTGERVYKVKAHELWNELLNQEELARLIAAGDFSEVVERAKRVETGINLLHPQFERTPLWKAVGEPQSAENFARSLQDFIYGQDALETRFARFAR
jgi:hypothetical protein